MEESDLRIVKLAIPFLDHNSKDEETWLALLEDDLKSNYQNYILEIFHDIYNRLTGVEITFNSIEDSTFFKLKRNYGFYTGR